MEHGHGRLGLDDVLAAAEDAAPVEPLDVVARNLRERFGALAVSFLLVDVVGEQVVRISEDVATQQGRAADQIALPGSVYDEVLSTQRLRHLPHASDEILEQVRQAAHALAYIIVTDRRFTDLYHWGRRTTSMSLAAEIQHRLLPSASCCEAPQFALAAGLVPADNVRGDTYDYTLDAETVHLSITDAMGHDVEAALLATLLVGASRQARRAGCDVSDQARQIHRAIIDHGRGAFATGQLIRIALDGTTVQLVNAGHPWPLRLRDGEVRKVRLDVHLPFGVETSTCPP